MNLSEQAEEIFSGFGRRFNLICERKTYDDGDICVVYDRQIGLQEKVWMCFGNIDEISFGVGEFFGGSAFPCPEAFDGFIEDMDGILSGRYRIRYGWFRSVLEEPFDKTWKIRERYSGPTWNGFRFKVFANTPQ
ncbi:hypothetical protein [Roseinatronobacter sp. S2]|uniref:hypothetical protein n=1 Tax=Roseinatronobacter sp. S2 TaxID=3035471 RepID=UPI00240F4212|nr:hypothetical protein [Roseinatronobacter sp. S2]WFE75777.1 hypothetical protein P8S53_05050 [Roseinatronobacter sp. S2]